ncbi:MAG TPA: protein kinase [Blastococcus sp.]|nr:protein kinase [Blastococcus sp.]
MEGSPLPVIADVDDGRPVWDPRPGTPLVPAHLAWAPISVGHHRETWLTWSVELWTPAVVKMLRPGWSRRWTEALTREVQALRGRVHPAFPRLLKDGRADAVPFLAVEYLDGPALDESITADGPLPAGDAARLGVLLFGAVRSLHASGTAHLDISPGNVLIVDRKARLIDLGAARPLGRRLRRGERIGTDGFAAPELAEGCAGPVTAAMDVFGVGATLRDALDAGSQDADRVADLLDWFTEPSPDRRPGPDVAMAALVRAAGTGAARPWPRWADRELPRPPVRVRAT